MLVIIKTITKWFLNAGLILFLAFVLSGIDLAAQHEGRAITLFDDDWQFFRGDVEGAEIPNFNDNFWRKVNLPHDWSIEDLEAVDYDDRLVINVVRDNWRFYPGDRMAWRETTFDDGSWSEVNLPQDWATHSAYNDKDAYGWYRKELIIPRDAKGKEVYLNLGKIADVDQVYLNGEIIGNSGSFPPDFRPATTQTRQYKVPDKLIDHGKSHVLAVRVYCKEGRGGIFAMGNSQYVKGPFDSHSETGRQSGFTRYGTGWYRKTFRIPEEYAGKKIQLLFEGIYKNANIWINGQDLGSHPNGYSSFWKDLTPHIDYNGKNTIAIRVDNRGKTSRWYSGSGIYRHVWMVVSNHIHIENWGVTIQTETLDKELAALVLKARVKNDSEDTVMVRFRTEILGPENEQVLFDVREEELKAGAVSIVKQDFFIPTPSAWSPATPSLYRAICTIIKNGVFLDRVEVPFGIRTLKFDTIKGFQLNGEALFLKGGNIHHDHGILGSKSFDDAEERKVKLLLKHGFNAVRCAHNPPSPAFLDACDRLGLLVVLEAFDVWEKPKVLDDYSWFFNDWWRTDLNNIIKRDINHPSVILWSIGNDVPEGLTADGFFKARQLAGFTRTLDPTRPVTAALQTPDSLWAQADTFYSALNIAGYNYSHHQYEKDHVRNKNRLMIGMESYPSQINETWNLVETLPYLIGDFTWSAMDYLGEAGKGWYGFENEPLSLFPWTSAYCGDLDLLGDPRPQWYYRRLFWEKRPQTYIMVRPSKPSFNERTNMNWGWQDVVKSWSWYGHEMVFFEVHVYTNCERVKLYSNGKVVAEKRLAESDNNMALFYVPYHEGSLRAIGFNGKTPVAQDILISAGMPAKLVLKPDVKTLAANGQDLMFVSVEVQDAKGQVHPMAAAPLEFSLKGPAEIIAIGNADPQNIESLTDAYHKTYQGKCMAVIRATRKPGEVLLEVSANGVKTESLVFQVLPN